METYTGAGQNDDVAGLAEESHRIVDGVILGKFRSSGELARDRDRQKRVVGLIGRAVEERRGYDPKRRA